MIAEPRSRARLAKSRHDAAYVVVSGLTETGAIGWIVQHILGRPGNMRQAQARLMAPAAALPAAVGAPMDCRRAR